MEELGSHIISGSTEQHSIVLQDLFEDNERVVYLNQLTLPSSMPSFKLRDILMTAGGLEDGSIHPLTTTSTTNISKATMAFIFYSGTG